MEQNLRLSRSGVVWSKGILALVALAVVSALLIFEVQTTPKPDSKARLTPYLEREAYRVYEAVMIQNPAYTKAGLPLVRAETVYYPPDLDCPKPAGKYEVSVNAALADYKQRNRRSVELQAQWFQVQKHLRLIPGSELLAHPGVPGFIVLSQVGFNPERTVALVYVANFCGAMCGQGDLLVLTKEHEHWRPLYLRGLACGWVA